MTRRARRAPGRRPHQGQGGDRALGPAPKDCTSCRSSNEARALGDDYLVNVGRWENSFTTANGRHVTMDVRTTEVLARTGDKWLYLVDHASVGVPRPAERVRARRGRR